MALILFGVTVTEAQVVHPPAPGTELVVVRDLAAICVASDYSAAEPSVERVERYSEIVGAYAAIGPVLPAPVGVVFRTRDTVQRWMELHYVALSDALRFVENRVVGRVHVWRPSDAAEREAGADLAATAAESLRVLRRGVVSTVPLRTEKFTGIVVSAAFLVEEELWKEFAAEVEQQGRRAPDLRFELTGPWPPYDFVQMRLGA